jgi:hypothetical protein
VVPYNYSGADKFLLCGEHIAEEEAREEENTGKAIEQLPRKFSETGFADLNNFLK